MTQSPRDLYNATSDNWVRDRPSLLADCTALPFILDWCEPIAGCNVLDVGCGEGYFARRPHERVADQIDGIDFSDAMIRNALKIEDAAPTGIRYSVADAAGPGSVAGAP